MPAELRGRVLVVGTRTASEALRGRLLANGFVCDVAEAVEAVPGLAASLQPEVILMASTPKQAAELLEGLRGLSLLRHVPVLADVSRSRSSEALKKLSVDGFIRSAEEMVPRVEEALRAGRLRESEERTRLRMGMLLEISQAATSSLELEEILRIAVDKVGRVTGSDRCSVVLVEGSHARTGTVVATQEDPSLVRLEIEISRYPELRRSLETRQSVLIETAENDPLMAEVRPNIAPLGVRSILVQPLICQDDLLGALFLRHSREGTQFGRDEQEFAQAVAGVLANSIRNARLHTALKRKREDLELAYVERYRELSDANRRLKELNRLKDEIIAVCSHDLRAPLQVLLGHGRLLLESPITPEQKQSVDAMLRQGRKILGLVESLLEKGKGEAARLSIEPRRLDMGQLCKESTTELNILASQRGVTLRAEAPESLMLIGDEVKLHEVLQNLITNAIHHAKDSGQVVVRALRLTRPDGDAVKITVQDDGAGIPPNELHLVFDRYRHGPKGTGLGLAICKEFVELHGGEIWAETPPEGGCTFVFTLPMAQEAPRKKAPEREEKEQQPRVLVVEDEAEIAAVLAEVLRSRYRVEVARDGQEGVAKVRNLRPDLVVMDVFLPKLDGLEATVALKSSSDTAHIPIILLSAHQGVAEKVRALNLGAVDYMSKPFKAMELLSRTERALKSPAPEPEVERSSAVLMRSIGDQGSHPLYDKRTLVAKLEVEASKSRRYHQPLSVAVLRPERSLMEMPRGVGEVLRKGLRNQDAVAHMGSGVFAIMLPECGVEGARAVIHRLLPELQAVSGVAFQQAVVDVSQDSDAVDIILEKLGAPMGE